MRLVTAAPLAWGLLLACGSTNDESRDPIGSRAGASASGVGGATVAGGASGNAPASGGTGAGNAAGASIAGSGNSGGSGAAPLFPACDIELTDIALSQVTEIPLVTAGAEIAAQARAAPVVQGRQALFRVYARPTGPPHPVTARLSITTGSTTHVYSDIKTLGSASTTSSLESTFDLRVDAEAMASDARYVVELGEAESCTGTRETARYPAAGEAELGAIQTAMVRVLLVPVHSLGGFEPAADQQLVDRLISEGAARYPATKFEIAVSPLPLETGVALGSEYSQGWAATLDALGARLLEDAPDFDLHYFGLLRPSEAPRGGVAGLASGNGRVGSAGIGLSYPGDAAGTAETFVHELGHMHSLKHSPGCDADNPNPAYPNSSGLLDAWGWDSRTNTLVDPSHHYDLMSYCAPSWTSQFVYKDLAQFVAQIASRSQLHAALPLVPYDTVIVAADGSASWGSHFSSRFVPDGAALPLEALDARGVTVARLTGYRLALPDAGAALVRIANLPPAWSALHVPGALRPLAPR
jgi:hypothetical protein